MIKEKKKDQRRRRVCGEPVWLNSDLDEGCRFPWQQMERGEEPGRAAPALASGAPAGVATLLAFISSTWERREVPTQQLRFL